MFSFIRRIWNDPVGSKVVATGVVAALASPFFSGTLEIVLIILGAIIIATGLVPVFTSKTESKIILVDEGRITTIKQPKFSRLTRRVVLSSVILAFILSTAHFVVRFWKRDSSNEVKMLIARFEGPDSKSYRVQEIILAQLQRATKEYGDVSIQALDKEITAQEGSEVARAEGKNLRAAVIVWGWYGTTSEKAIITIHFEILEKPKLLDLKSNNEVLTIDRSQLETYTIQQQLSQEMTYLILVTLGIALYEAEDYEGAISRYTDALTQVAVPHQMVDPAMLYFLRGMCYDFRDDNKALADYDQALKLNPNWANALESRGRIYFDQDDFDRALSDFNRAISIDSKALIAIYLRAGIYLWRNLFESAIADYSLFISLKSEFANAFCNRGIAYAKMGEEARAFDDFNQAIRLNPNYAPAYRQRGTGYLREDKLDLAISDFNQAITLDPQEPQSFIKRGGAYLTKPEY
jgi:tetratricopeptide (TPR) repeat protein